MNKKNITRLMNKVRNHKWPIIFLSFVLGSYIIWPPFVSWWASGAHESNDDGATTAQFQVFSELYSSLGVLFTGLAFFGTLLLLINANKQTRFAKIQLTQQKRHAKKQLTLAIEQLTQERQQAEQQLKLANEQLTEQKQQAEQQLKIANEQLTQQKQQAEKQLKVANEQLAQQKQQAEEQSNLLKKQLKQQQQQLFQKFIWQEKKSREDKFHNMLSLDCENINYARKNLLYCNKNIMNPEPATRTEIEGAKLLIEVGGVFDSLMHNLGRAEAKGFTEMFANTKDFAETFIKEMEMGFQMFAACESWMGTFLNAMDNIDTYGTLLPMEKKRCKEYLQNPLIRHEKMLLGAYYIAKGRAEHMPKIFRDTLFENTCEAVQNCMIKLFKTFELRGDGDYARIKIIEEIGEFLYEKVAGMVPEKLGPILAWADQYSKISLEKACELTKDKNMAIRMLNMGELLGWLRVGHPSGVKADAAERDLFYITAKGHDFVASTFI